MKTICFLLSLYVFSLSVVPCCSDTDCNDEIISEHTEKHSQEHEEEEEEEGDCKTCSPFLNCGTCIGFVFNNLQINIDEIPVDNNQFVPVYKSQFYDDFMVKIWQPPKII